MLISLYMSTFTHRAHIRIFHVLLFLSIIGLTPGCSPSTRITGTWKNPNSDADSISSILVTALTSRANNRQTVESDLAAALNQKGVQALRSMDVLPPSFSNGDTPDKATLLSKIRGSGVDAILTVALIDKETENRFVPGNYGYAPMSRFGYYGQFWGYYSAWLPVVHSQGYYQQDKTYFLETNLYDAETEALIWSAQSETYNPSDLSSFSKEFARVILGKLEQEQIINGVRI